MEEALSKYIVSYIESKRDVSPSDAPIKKVHKIYTELPDLFQDSKTDYLSVEMERSDFTRTQLGLTNTISFAIYYHQFIKSGYATANSNFTGVTIKENAKKLLTGRNNNCEGDEWSVLNIIYGMSNTSKCTNGNVKGDGCILANFFEVSSIDRGVPQAVFSEGTYVCRLNCTAIISDVKLILGA